MINNKLVIGIGSILVLMTTILLNIPSQIANAQPEGEIVAAEGLEAKSNLDRFDKLDFEAWNNRNWTLFEEIHSPDVLVVDFNGNVTKGIEEHLQWAEKAVSSVPSKILAHPIKIATGNWTAVTGNSTRTDLSTGESFNNTMVTVAHWKDGKIIEEYLFSH